MTLSVSHVVMVRQTLFQFQHLCMHSSLAVLPQHFSRVGQTHSFPFQIFCCRFAAVLGVIVLLHDSVSARLEL